MKFELSKWNKNRAANENILRFKCVPEAAPWLINSKYKDAVELIFKL